MTTIQCLCGEIELELSGDPVVQLYCHCDDCQLVHGGAFVATAVYKSEHVTVVSGEPRVWRLKTTPRHICPNCGTRLFAEGSPALRGVNAYLLPPGSFKPAAHIYCKFAAVPLRDELPHYASVPARWGGSDEQVDFEAPRPAHSELRRH